MAERTLEGQTGPEEQGVCHRCGGSGDEPWELMPGAMTQFEDWSKPSGVPCLACRGSGRGDGTLRRDQVRGPADR
jgi:hypothetical protein